MYLSLENKSAPDRSPIFYVPDYGSECKKLKKIAQKSGSKRYLVDTGILTNSISALNHVRKSLEKRGVADPQLLVWSYGQLKALHKLADLDKLLTTTHIEAEYTIAMPIFNHVNRKLNDFGHNDRVVMEYQRRVYSLQQTLFDKIEVVKFTHLGGKTLDWWLEIYKNCEGFLPEYYNGREIKQVRDSDLGLLVAASVLNEEDSLNQYKVITADGDLTREPKLVVNGKIFTPPEIHFGKPCCKFNSFKDLFVDLHYSSLEPELSQSF